MLVPQQGGAVGAAQHAHQQVARDLREVGMAEESADLRGNREEGSGARGEQQNALHRHRMPA